MFQLLIIFICVGSDSPSLFLIGLECPYIRSQSSVCCSHWIVCRKICGNNRHYRWITQRASLIPLIIKSVSEVRLVSLQTSVLIQLFPEVRLVARISVSATRV